MNNPPHNRRSDEEEALIQADSIIQNKINHDGSATLSGDDLIKVTKAIHEAQDAIANLYTQLSTKESQLEESHKELFAFRSGSITCNHCGNNQISPVIDETKVPQGTAYLTRDEFKLLKRLQSDSKFNELAVYNSEVSRGIVHTEEKVARMNALQAEYDNLFMPFYFISTDS